jgi:hypothetical protein
MASLSVKSAEELWRGLNRSVSTLVRLDEDRFIEFTHPNSRRQAPEITYEVQRKIRPQKGFQRR